MPFTALYDACVLYPAPLRDLLMELAKTDLFRAKWTDEIHEEWMSNVLANRQDLRRETLERTRELMNTSVRDCLVVGYESLIPALTLPDPGDRHVLAAAIRGRADLIVTFNLRDFPPECLDQYDIKSQHPDDFITHLLDLDEAVVIEAAKTVRARLKRPPIPPDKYLDTLESQSLPQTVAWLRHFSGLI